MLAGLGEQRRTPTPQSRSAGTTDNSPATVPRHAPRAEEQVPGSGLKRFPSSLPKARAQRERSARIISGRSTFQVFGGIVGAKNSLKSGTFGSLATYSEPSREDGRKRILTYHARARLNVGCNG